MNELNKEYFKTREIHKKSFNKNVWITWVIFLAIGLFGVFREILIQKDKSLTEENILEKTTEFELAQSDKNFISPDKDFQIKVRKGFYFGTISDEMPLMIMSKDSIEFMLFVKKTKSDKKYDSLLKQWESKIIKTDSTYKFSQIIEISENNLRKEIGNVELLKNGKDFFGRIIIIHRKMDIYIIQGITLKKTWETNKSDVNDMLESFEIK